MWLHSCMSKPDCIKLLWITVFAIILCSLIAFPADQPSSLDNAGPDIQSASHPPNVQKPPMPPAQSHPQPSLQPPIIPPHSQSTGALQFHSPVQPQSLNPSAQVQGLSHSLPPPYKFTTEDLNKEDVIFFWTYDRGKNQSRDWSSSPLNHKAHSEEHLPCDHVNADALFQ